jgi:hypothetical protein
MLRKRERVSDDDKGDIFVLASTQLETASRSLQTKL